MYAKRQASKPEAPKPEAAEPEAANTEASQSSLVLPDNAAGPLCNVIESVIDFRWDDAVTDPVTGKVVGYKDPDKGIQIFHFFGPRGNTLTNAEFLQFLEAILKNAKVCDHPLCLPILKWSPLNRDRTGEPEIRLCISENVISLANSGPEAPYKITSVQLYCVALYLRFLTQTAKLRHGAVRPDAIYLYPDGHAEMVFLGFEPPSLGPKQNIIDFRSLCREVTLSDSPESATVLEQIAGSQNFDEVLAAFDGIKDSRLQAEFGHWRDVCANKDADWSNKSEGQESPFLSPEFLNGLYSPCPNVSRKHLRELLAQLPIGTRSTQTLTLTGLVFEKGIGVEIDARIAYRCYDLAGAFDLRNALIKSEDHLILAQVAEAQGAEAQGEAAEKHFERAVIEYTNCGTLKAFAHLGDLLAASSDVDTRQAGISLLESARGFGSGFASFALGRAYLTDNAQKAMSLFEEAKARGYADVEELLKSDERSVRELLLGRQALFDKPN
jgi:hypothetical protein